MLQSAVQGRAGAAGLSIRGEREILPSEYSLLIGLQDGAGVTLSEGEAPFRRGHALMLLPGRAARLRSDTDVRFIAISFDEATVLTSCLPALAGNSVMSDFFLCETREEGHLSFIEMDYLTPGMLALAELLAEIGTPRDLEEKLLAQGILCELLCAATANCFMHAVLTHGPGQENYQKVCAGLLRTGGALALPQAAELCYCHANTLSRAFRRASGMSYGDFRQLVRLSFAARRLRGGRDTVRVVAAEYGYANTTNFYRQFKQVYGVVPGDYQELFAQ